jgi:hypothetical protein
VLPAWGVGVAAMGALRGLIVLPTLTWAAGWESDDAGPLSDQFTETMMSLVR